LDPQKLKLDQVRTLAQDGLDCKPVLVSWELVTGVCKRAFGRAMAKG
jgi:hypothetical protein